MKTKRASLITSAQVIVDRAKAGDRDLTAHESAEVEGIFGEIKQIDTEHADWQKSADASDALMARISALGTPGAPGKYGAKGYLDLSGQTIAAKALHRADGTERIGIKSLLAAGEQVVGTTMLDAMPAMSKPATGLLDVLPSVTVEPHFAYLQQIARSNGAKFVAPGDLKPTSTYGLNRVEGRLGVLAHLSEPIDEYWLEDNTALRTFLTDEMTYGLRVGLEGQVLNGDGVGENLLGLLRVSGIQTVAYATNLINTIRDGIGAVENLGMVPSAIVMSPTDWKAVETATVTGGAYLLGPNSQSTGGGAPVDRVLRRLWGTPVVLAVANALPAKTALVLAENAAEVFTDQGLKLTWGSVGDDFSRNQVRCRLEGRFALGVQHPAGVVKVATAA